MSMQRHMIPIENVLNPDGIPQGPNSLSYSVLYKMVIPQFNTWVDKNYEDSVSPSEALTYFEKALNREFLEVIRGLREHARSIE